MGSIEIPVVEVGLTPHDKSPDTIALLKDPDRADADNKSNRTPMLKPIFAVEVGDEVPFEKKCVDDLIPVKLEISVSDEQDARSDDNTEASDQSVQVKNLNDYETSLTGGPSSEKILSQDCSDVVPGENKIEIMVFDENANTAEFISKCNEDNKESNPLEPVKEERSLQPLPSDKEEIMSVPCANIIGDERRDSASSLVVEDVFESSDAEAAGVSKAVSDGLPFKEQGSNQVEKATPTQRSVLVSGRELKVSGTGRVSDGGSRSEPGPLMTRKLR